LDLHLRPVSIADCELLFGWVNEPEVRKNSFNHQMVDFESHQIWFQKKINEGLPWYILELSGQPSGVIRFDLSENGFKINFSISASQRGKGLGKEIIRLGLSEITRIPHNSIFVFGLVKKQNIASAKCFLSNQFLQNDYDQNTYIFQKKLG